MANTGLAILTAAGAAACVAASLRVIVRSRADHDDGLTVVRYGPALRIFACCFLVLPLMLTYGVLSDSSNQTGVMALAVLVTCAIALPLVLEAFGVRIAFDDEYIYTKSPWRSSRRISWTDVTSLTFTPGLDWHVIHTRSHGNVRAHTALRGLRELLDGTRAQRARNEVVGASGVNVTASHEQRRQKIRQLEESVAPDALERKLRSESILRTEGVPINLHLPPIESEGSSTRRSTNEVAFRALALLVVAVKGEGLEQDIIDELLERYGLAFALTPEERTFVEDDTPSPQNRAQLTWRYEAAWVLLWALGYIDSLEKPTTICDVRKAVGLMHERSAEQFVESAKLRSQSELLDWADRIYRYHWAVTEARVQDRASPADLEPGVVLERHHALNWLIGYMDQPWDEISTDT